jgi:hypothetical protein
MLPSFERSKFRPDENNGSHHRGILRRMWMLSSNVTVSLDDKVKTSLIIGRERGEVWTLEEPMGGSSRAKLSEARG